MNYQYQVERPKLFTEEGQVMLLKIRDTAHELLKQSGAFQMAKVWRDVSGDTWQMMACVDRLVELGELRRVTPVGSVAGQHEVFIDAR